MVEGGDQAEKRATTSPDRTRRSASTPVHYAYFPRFDSAPDGSRCVRVVRRAYPDALSAATATDAQDRLVALALAVQPRCVAAGPPAAVPADHAAEFWRVAGEDLLPRPSPRIAPGFMLAGKMAYLETGSVPTARFEHPTPLGLLTIEATSRIFVDWGDGSPVDGPHPGPGGPWPDGTITHFWTHADVYDIRVQQRWTGRWEVGGHSGGLVGLATEGRIDDFEVRDLQAVRNF